MNRLIGVAALAALAALTFTACSSGPETPTAWDLQAQAQQDHYARQREQAALTRAVADGVACALRRQEKPDTLGFGVARPAWAAC